MSHRFLYAKIFATNNIHPVYSPQLKIVLDKRSGKIFMQLKKLDILPFVVFRLEFDSYRYIDIYQPHTQSFNKEICYSVYNLMMYINMNANYYKRNAINQMLYDDLAFHFVEIQLFEIKRRKDYTIATNKLDEFVNNRETHRMYFHPWIYYKLDETHSFDLEARRMVPTNKVKKVFFHRYGGIIETNNIQQVIDRFTKQGTLVIAPDSILNLYKKTGKISYIKLFKFKESDLIIWKSYKRVVIHECHVKFLPRIKRLLGLLNCQTVWVINGQPLYHYFKSRQVTVNDVISLSNIWMNIDTKKKGCYKTSLLKLAFTEFNKYYVQINYERHIAIPTYKTLTLSPFEKNIYSLFNIHFSNWKDKLANDPNNIYSFASRNKIDKLDAKILNALIYLINSTTDLENIQKILVKKANQELEITNLEYDSLTSAFDEHKLHPRYLSMFEDRKTKLRTTIKNYQRYSTVSTVIDTTCPICYETDITKTKLICGHMVCLECMLNTLSHANECPICKEVIRIDKIAIIQEDNHSEIRDYFSSLDKDTYIITDFFAVSDSLKYNNHKFQILDVKKHTNIKKLVVLVSPLNKEKSEKIIDFLRQINDLEVTYINVQK